MLDENCQCCNGEHNSDAGDANRNNGENRVPSHVLKAQKTNVVRDYAKKNMYSYCFDDTSDILSKRCDDPHQVQGHLSKYLRYLRTPIEFLHPK